MNGTQSDNTNSLSLAIGARKAVKALMVSEASGILDEQLRQVLADAVASLNALNSGTPLYANLSKASSFESYDQIRAVHEVQLAMSDGRLTERLQLLLTDSAGEHVQENKEYAIQFFTAIENRALQNYNQSFQFSR
ncbi:MAG: hypothetical protein ABSC48_12250 [Terracidiphilus sp.]|jgi:predicted signal transduction protein with EAL and GGDEF domain